MFQDNFSKALHQKQDEVATLVKTGEFNTSALSVQLAFLNGQFGVIPVLMAAAYLAGKMDAENNIPVDLDVWGEVNTQEKEE